jgi:CubicO group peptidase (beta-lactamase class C family)
MGEAESNLPRALAAIGRGFEQRLHVAAQLYVTLRGQVMADVALGEARPGVPMRTDTLMPWLSACKPIAAVAIAQLWQLGRLDLDDPIAKHIPEFAAGGKERISIRHILTHTAGVRLVPGDFERQPWDKIIADICAVKLEPSWIIGRTAGYHPATSWYILGEIIRRTDGRPFDDYVRAEICEPRRMNDTWFALVPEQLQEYGKRIGRLHDMTIDHPPSAKVIDSDEIAQQPRPGSSARGPARELGLFYENLKRILWPQTVEALAAKHRVGMYDKTFRHTMDWGLGFMVQSNQYGIETLPYSFGPHASPRTFGHGGSRSSVGYCDPEHGLVVAAIFSRTRTEAQHHQRMLEINTAIYEDLKLIVT